MVAGFAQAAPNARLMHVAADALRRNPDGHRALDLGCGAGRNALPLAALGWDVLGLDSSRPMLESARRRLDGEALAGSVRLALATMDHIPARSAAFDLVVAHGIWNLARSGAEFRDAVRDAGRAAAPGATLFVFTFSRTTVPPSAEPVPGEAFVFTEFSGQPQCFLTETQLAAELAAGGFDPAPGEALRELNRPSARGWQAQSTPVIFEGVFRRRT